MGIFPMPHFLYIASAVRQKAVKERLYRGSKFHGRAALHVFISDP